MNLIYFDCISGAAGDMLLGALLDAGAPETTVRRALDGLHVEGWTLRRDQVTKSGLRATRVTVTAEDPAPSRDHATIRSILAAAELDGPVRERALRSFQILAEAEARIHDSHPDDVHFHELGGIDALIDIVGCAAAIDHFEPAKVVTSTITTGRGWTDSAHGPLPVPAPATLEILRGATLVERGERELVTPTGAAVLAAATDEFGPMPPHRLEAIGYGAGEVDLAWPNVTRVLVGTLLDEHLPRGAWLIETNIDDMSPELMPHSIESLIRAGASDAWVTPIVMKKGRPAVTLSVLVGELAKERVLDVLYRETTTLGVRIQRVGKDELEREWVEVSVDDQPVRVKVALRGGEVVTVSPEFEDAARAARASGLALRDVYDRARDLARSNLEHRL